MKTKLIWLALAFLPLETQAAISPELSQYFSEKIDRVEQSACLLGTGPQSLMDNMVLQDINIDLTPSVSVGLNSVLNLTLSPEIDFVLVPSTSN
jgi:hypothetical protein